MEGGNFPHFSGLLESVPDSHDDVRIKTCSKNLFSDIIVYLEIFDFDSGHCALLCRWIVPYMASNVIFFNIFYRFHREKTSKPDSMARFVLDQLFATLAATFRKSRSFRGFRCRVPILHSKMENLPAGKKTSASTFF